MGGRTSGAGGKTSAHITGIFSGALAFASITLVLRREPVATAEFPTTRYIENVGVRPDVPIEIMTRDNLMSGYRNFVEGFTAAIADEIQRKGNSGNA